MMKRRGPPSQGWKPIHLNRFDLNLLVVLNRVYVDRSVTRAAASLNLTQSAVVVGAETFDNPSLKRMKVAQDHLVVAARAGHPLVSRQQISLRNYQAAEHIAVTGTSRQPTEDDLVLSRLRPGAPHPHSSASLRSGDGHCCKDGLAFDAPAEIRAGHQFGVRPRPRASTHQNGTDGVLPALAHLNDSRSCGTVAAGRIGPVLPI
jgi:DNA-binding transcriptional LysR family regulator